MLNLHNLWPKLTCQTTMFDKSSVKRRRRMQTPSASENVVWRSGFRTRKPAPARLRMADAHACCKMKARRKWKEVLDSAKCSNATSQSQLSLNYWTAMGVQDAGTKYKWPLEGRRSNVPKKRTLAEDEEEEHKIETETFSQCLRPSGQPEATSGERVGVQSSLARVSCRE